MGFGSSPREQGSHLRAANMSSIFAVVSDIHSGSKVAVCPPNVTITDGAWTANKWQLWLWTRWVEYWDYVKFLRGRGRKKKKLHVGILGEIGEGDHHGSLQNFVLGDTDKQKDVAMATLEPIFNLKPDFMHIRAGTEAHSGKDGQFDETIAKAILNEKKLNVVPHPVTGKYAPNKGDVKIEGVLFDLAHHGKTGNLKWTKLNGAFQLANTISYSRLERHEALGDPVPHIAVRGHKHTYADTYKNARVRLICLSSWKAEDNFFHRIAIEDPPKYGGVIVLIDGKKYEVDDTMAQMMMPSDPYWIAPE